MIRTGLIGFGKAGQAVARVLAADPGIDLRWIAQRTPAAAPGDLARIAPAMVAFNAQNVQALLHDMPVDALVDFSAPEALHVYAGAVRQHQLLLVSAISAYAPADKACLAELGQTNRVMSSPNITVGVNFLILAARLLRGIAPFADVEIIEQHFREKPEVSGTAYRLAETLQLEKDRVTSLRLGGIVGMHEVIFGFPHQTVRITHNAIRREAFGTGAVFALHALSQCPPGLYSFDDLLMQKVRESLRA